MKYEDLGFMTPVIVNNKLERRTKPRETVAGDDAPGYYGKRKVWEPNPFTKWEPVEGLLLGYRTVSDGVRRIYSDHIEYNTKEYKKVALVVIGPNRNPFYSDNIEPLDLAPAHILQDWLTRAADLLEDRIVNNKKQDQEDYRQINVDSELLYCINFVTYNYKNL